jgi:hypothetical protein
MILRTNTNYFPHIIICLGFLKNKDCVLCEIGPVILYKFRMNIGLQILNVICPNILKTEIKPYPFITYYCANMNKDVSERSEAKNCILASL